MKTFALLLWLTCRGGIADYGIPSTPEQCQSLGVAVAEEVRKLTGADLPWSCGFYGEPPPDAADCYP
jgi:hypothetical protein